MNEEKDMLQATTWQLAETGVQTWYHDCRIVCKQVHLFHEAVSTTVLMLTFPGAATLEFSHS